MPYLIDGHNLIAALSDIALDDPDDEVKLVLKLRAWCAHTGRKAIVYFDGGLPGGVARDLSTSQLRVIFAAAERSSADALIKAQLQRLKDARNWTVVTSDREILTVAYRRGAHGLKSQAFAAELTRVSLPPMPEEAERKSEGVFGSELEYWLQEFSQSEKKAAQPLAAPADKAPDAPASSQSAARGRKTSPPRPSQQSDAPVSGVPLGDLAPELKALSQAGPQPEREAPEPEQGEKPPLPTPEEIAAWLKEFPEPEGPIGPPPPKPAPPRPLRPGQAKPQDITRAELAEWLHLFGAAENDAADADEDAATMERLFGPRRPPRKKP